MMHKYFMKKETRSWLVNTFILIAILCLFFSKSYAEGASAILCAIFFLIYRVVFKLEEFLESREVVKDEV